MKMAWPTGRNEGSEDSPASAHEIVRFLRGLNGPSTGKISGA